MVTLSHPEPSSPEPLCIDCDDCALQNTEACRDCIVTFLCGVDASQPVVVDLAEARALRVLGEAGLAPPILFSRRLDSSGLRAAPLKARPGLRPATMGS